MSGPPADPLGRESGPPGRSLRTRPGSPPTLLVTLLADYWWGRAEPLPSAALVELLADFGVSDAAARVALSRLVKRDLLVGARSGRTTRYRLSDRASRILDEGAAALAAFGADAEPWSGCWSLIAFSVPETSRPSRERLRAALRCLGFAPLYDGLWVSPHDRHQDALTQLRALGIATATAFTATVPDGSPRDGLPHTAWELTELATQYDQFIQRCQTLRADLEHGRIDAVGAMVNRTRLTDAWLTFFERDPGLPAQLLPKDWPRSRAREQFLQAYDALGEPACARVREVLATYAPEIAPLAAPHQLRTAGARSVRRRRRRPVR